MAGKKNKGLWMQVSVEFPNDPMVIAACAQTKNADPALLFLAAIGYIKKYRLQGTIPVAAVTGICAIVKRPASAAKALCAAGLFTHEGTDYVVPSWAKWNQADAYTADDADDQADDATARERRAWREQKRLQRSRTSGHVHPGQTGGHDTGQHPGHGADIEADNTPDNGADTHAPARDARSDSYSPSEGVDREGGAGETRAAGPGAKAFTPPKSRSGAQQDAFHNRNCWGPPEACRRGLCVPLWLGKQWQAQDESIEATAAFITEVLAQTPRGTSIGDDLLTWWRAQRRAKFGSAAPGRAADRAAEVSQSNRAVTDRVVEQLLAQQPAGVAS